MLWMTAIGLECPNAVHITDSVMNTLTAITIHEKLTITMMNDPIKGQEVKRQI